ncbi:MAG TPA: hypothetical protein ENK18_09355 [Deltaproteobacteria bacterium]|nr:hypothetical protein [Deltaproteobacteria bacterium]
MELPGQGAGGRHGDADGRARVRLCGSRRLADPRRLPAPAARCAGGHLHPVPPGRRGRGRLELHRHDPGGLGGDRRSDPHLPGGEPGPRAGRCTVPRLRGLLELRPVSERPQPTITITEDPGRVAGELLRSSLQRTVERRGRARLAIPGGGSPVPVFRWLAAHLPDALARALTVTWVDERHLPLPDGGDRRSLPDGGDWRSLPDGGDWRSLPAESNLRGAWEHWLSRAPICPQLLPLALPGSLEQARRQLEERFVAQLGGLDVVLLGAGPDGHIASLFPGHPAADLPGPVIALSDSPKPPPERLSLSMSVLEQVDHAVLVATGAGKAPVLARALDRDPELPLGRYHPRGALDWVLDPSAAHLLPELT